MDLHVDRPDFTIDESDENYELWTFRVPLRFPTKSLNGVEIELQDGEMSVPFTSDDGEPVRFTTEDGKKFLVEAGERDGLDSFRALMPFDDEDDDEDDEDDEDEEAKADVKFNLQPTCKPFVRHFDVFVDYERMTDRQVAPLQGPEPVDKIRHAYSHVPQRTGMIRRWMPPGTKQPKRERKPITYVPAPRPPSPEEVDTPRKRQREDGESTDKSKEERKSEKKARKEEKKAKKAEKKATKKEKKAAKKAKK
jgi:hypothetical protein